jgi:tRNA(Glu) U13 pseudouridine synthase TruD
MERARKFECELQGEGSPDEGVVVQFELAAGSYATSFLFEMCAGGTS